MPGGVDWFAYTSGLRATGFMRTDRAPADAPFDADDIAHGFELTVFNPEGDPFGTGWLVKIKVTDNAGIGDLMDHAAYQKQCEEEG